MLAEIVLYNVERLLEERSLTPQDLVRRGLSRSALASLWAANGGIHLRRLDQIAEALSVPMSELFRIPDKFDQSET